MLSEQYVEELSDHASGPPLCTVSVPGGYEQYCQGCETAMVERHTWEACTAGLRARVAELTAQLEALSNRKDLHPWERKLTPEDLHDGLVLLQRNPLESDNHTRYVIYRAASVADGREKVPPGVFPAWWICTDGESLDALYGQDHLLVAFCPSGEPDGAKRMTAPLNIPPKCRSCGAYHDEGANVSLCLY